MINNMIIFLVLYTFVLFFDYGCIGFPLKYRNCLKVKIPVAVKYGLLLFHLTDKKNKIVFSAIVSRLFIYCCMLYCIMKWVNTSDISMVPEIIRSSNLVAFLGIFDIHLLWYIIVVLVTNIKGTENLMKEREKMYFDDIKEDVLYFALFEYKKSNIDGDIIYALFCHNEDNSYVAFTSKENGKLSNCHIIEKGKYMGLSNEMKNTIRKLDIRYKRAARENIELPKAILVAYDTGTVDIRKKQKIKKQEDIDSIYKYELINDDIDVSTIKDNIERLIEKYSS